MQRWMTAAIAAAALAATTGLAQADDHRGHDSHSSEGNWRGHDGGRNEHGGYDRHDYRGHDYRANEYRGNDYRASDYRANDSRGHEYRGRDSWYPHDSGNRGYGYYGHESRDWRGSGWRDSGWRESGSARWVRGGYLPRAYFGPRYIVRDYGYYGLRAPPVGYGWVRVDNDFLLAALATGFVADVLFGGY